LIPVRVAIKPGKGRAVLATKPIPAGDTIEVCPVLVMDQTVVPENISIVADNEISLLSHYVFHWENECEALVLGYGMLYCHSESANAWYDKDFRKRQIHYIAVRDIESGEEITVDYNQNGDSELWFDPV
jgi:uncharacterized protein